MWDARNAARAPLSISPCILGHSMKRCSRTRAFSAVQAANHVAMWPSSGSSQRITRRLDKRAVKADRQAGRQRAGRTLHGSAGRTHYGSAGRRAACGQGSPLGCMRRRAAWGFFIGQYEQGCAAGPSKNKSRARPACPCKQLAAESCSTLLSECSQSPRTDTRKQPYAKSKVSPPQVHPLYQPTPSSLNPTPANVPCCTTPAPPFLWCTPR